MTIINLSGQLNPNAKKVLGNAPYGGTVQYDYLDSNKLKKRTPGEDFQGNLTEFTHTFEWVWKNPERKILVEKKTGESFSGWIHIKDQRLDRRTYPTQEQKIKFLDGEFQVVASLEKNEKNDDNEETNSR